MGLDHRQSQSAQNATGPFGTGWGFNARNRRPRWSMQKDSGPFRPGPSSHRRSKVRLGQLRSGLQRFPQTGNPPVVFKSKAVAQIKCSFANPGCPGFTAPRALKDGTRLRACSALSMLGGCITAAVVQEGPGIRRRRESDTRAASGECRHPGLEAGTGARPIINRIFHIRSTIAKSARNRAGRSI